MGANYIRHKTFEQHSEAQKKQLLNEEENEKKISAMNRRMHCNSVEAKLKTVRTLSGGKATSHTCRHKWLHVLETAILNARSLVYALLKSVRIRIFNETNLGKSWVQVKIQMRLMPMVRPSTTNKNRYCTVIGFTPPFYSIN